MAADGVSLAYNFSQTYDYYKTNHNRNSIDTQIAPSWVRSDGTNYKNAFWTPEYNAMFFGTPRSMLRSGRVAHEYTHGITSFTCNLIYQDQSGASTNLFGYFR